MTTPAVLIEFSEAIATVSLNRPERLNAVDASLRVALTEALTGLGQDEAV